MSFSKVLQRPLAGVLILTLAHLDLAYSSCETDLLTTPCRVRGCISTTMNTSQPTNLPERPGELINGGERFILDQATMADIDTAGGLTKGLLDPVFAEIPTPLGRERLRWELQRPILDPNLIRARQNAIDSLLADNGKLLAQLKSLFEKHKKDGSLEHFEHREGTQHTVRRLVARPLHEDPVEALKRLQDPNLWRGISGDGYVLLQDLLAITMVGGVFGDLPGGIIFMAGAAHLAMYFARGAHEQDGFEEASHLVEIFERNNTKVVRALKSQTSPVLQQIAAELDMANNPKHPSSLVAARKSMRRAMILSNSLFLPGYVARTLATQKLNEKLENIVTYLDAFTELEMLMGLAQYKLKNKNSHKFLTIHDPESGIVDLNEVHNPFLLLNQNANGTPSRATHFHFSPENRVELVTGANAEGKSTGLRTEVQVSIANQVGYAVPAQGSTVPMVFITGNKVSDTVGKSLMMAQCERIGHMLNGAIKLAGQGYKVMLKFDEPFDGTSPEERRALVAAIIIYVGMKPNLYASIATHERSLIDLVTGLEAKPVGGTITAPSENPMSKYASALATVRNVHYSDYQKHDGGAVNRNALKIAAQMGMPEEVLSIAREILKEAGIISD